MVYRNKLLLTPSSACRYWRPSWSSWARTVGNPWCWLCSAYSHSGTRNPSLRTWAHYLQHKERERVSVSEIVTRPCSTNLSVCRTADCTCTAWWPSPCGIASCRTRRYSPRGSSSVSPHPWRCTCAAQSTTDVHRLLCTCSSSICAPPPVCLRPSRSVHWNRLRSTPRSRRYTPDKRERERAVVRPTSRAVWKTVIDSWVSIVSDSAHHYLYLGFFWATCIYYNRKYSSSTSE